MISQGLLEAALMVWRTQIHETVGEWNLSGAGSYRKLRAPRNLELTEFGTQVPTMCTLNSSHLHQKRRETDCTILDTP
ncbi:hypothetical protein J6590_068520, partial [Homalodisca vitripennis]